MFSSFGKFVGNIFGGGSTKRKRQQELDDDDYDNCDCDCSHHTTRKKPSCQKRRKICCSCDCNDKHDSLLSSISATEGTSTTTTDITNANATSNGTSSSNTDALTVSTVLSQTEMSGLYQLYQDIQNKLIAVTPSPTITDNNKAKDTPSADKLSATTPSSTNADKNNAKNITVVNKSSATTTSATNTDNNKANDAPAANKLSATTPSSTNADKNNAKDTTVVNKISATTPSAINNEAKDTAVANKVSATKTTQSKDKTTPPSASIGNAKAEEATELLLATEITLDQSIEMHTLDEAQINFLREELIFPLVNNTVFVSAGLSIERGLLLHGSYCDMIHVVNVFANELSRLFGKSTRIFTRTPRDIFRKYSTEAEEFMKKIDASVKKCEEDTPIIILIQDLHSFLHYCPTLKHDSSNSMTLSSAMRNHLRDKKYQRLFVIGTVTDLKIVPKTLLGPGMFAKTLAFPKQPGETTRNYYLKEAVKKWNVQPEDQLLEEMTKKTSRFSPDELHYLAQMVLQAALSDTVKEAVKGCCVKCLDNPSTLKVNENMIASINPTKKHWEDALQKLSQNVEVNKAVEVNKTVEVNNVVDPNITFSSVGGLDEQIKYLRENIIVPLKQKDVLKEWGVEPIRGIIFHGPPGTGKTLLAKAMANELNKVLEEEPSTSAESSKLSAENSTANAVKKQKKKYSFFYRKATDCFNKYVGETERILRELFTAAQKQAPSLIFFDEIDGLCPTRGSGTSQFQDGVVTTLLGLMDSVKRGEILVIAATNRLNTIDPAMRRAGRFDRAVGFSMPGKDERENILRIHTKAWKNGNDKEILEQMAEKTVGYSGADLEQLTRQTLLLGMQRLLEAKTQTLEIHPEDWHTTLSSKPISNAGKQAFGSSSTLLQQLPPGVKLLLQSNVKNIEEKFQPIFTDILEASKTNCNGRLNSFLISSGYEYNEDVDGYLVPLLLTESKLFKNVAPYTLDLSDVQRLTKESVQSTLSQLCSPPDGKIPLLLVPQIDMFIKMKDRTANAGGIVDYVLTQLQTFRGKNIILLATSKLSSKYTQGNEEILTLFKDIEGSKSHKFIPPSLLDLESFFKAIPQLEKVFPQQLTYVVKFGEGKDVGTLLDLHAELQRILQQNKGEDNKTKEVILQQLNSLFKAFDNYKKKGQNQFQMYV